MSKKKSPDAQLSKERDSGRADDAVEPEDSENSRSSEEIKVVIGVIAALSMGGHDEPVEWQSRVDYNHDSSILIDYEFMRESFLKLQPVVPEDKIQHASSKKRLANLLLALTPKSSSESVDVVAEIPWVETTLVSLTGLEGVVMNPPTTTETEFTPEEQQALMFSQFTGFGKANPDRAKFAAERLMEVAEELRPPSKERTLNMLQAAQRISLARGIHLDATQLKRWFLNPNIQIGALGPNGKPVFSEVECDSFELPDRKPGRPAKKI